jgi:hypothetical protein
LSASALDEIHREPARARLHVFDYMLAPVWRMGGDDLSEDTLMAPVAMQRQPSADRLDRAEGVPLARRLPLPL